MIVSQTNFSSSSLRSNVQDVIKGQSVYVCAIRGLCAFFVHGGAE